MELKTVLEKDKYGNITGLMDGFNDVKIYIHDIRVDGSNVHIDLEAEDGGDIPFKHDGVQYALDCTTGAGPGGVATVILEQGTDEVPLFQFIYLFYSESSGVVEVATSNIIPEDGVFRPVCYALCFTAAKVAASGMAYIHRVTDVASDGDRGALSYGREKIRLGGGNNRIVGCDVELEIVTNASVRDNIFVTSVPGTFYQLHRHNWAGYYSGDYDIRALSQLVGECTIPNYGMVTDLGTITEDSEGNALVDGDSIYVDIIGIGTSCSCKRLAFAISQRVYSTAQECIDTAKLKIALPYPKDIRHLCFTLARMVLTYSTANGGTWGNALSATTLVWKSDVISTTTPSYPSNYPSGYANYIGSTLTHSGAVAVRVHFRDFNTERNYDYVRLRNAGGTNIYSYHGSLGAFTSANMVGDTIRPYFQSDGSVTRKGCYIDRFEYQVEVTTGGGEIIDMR